MAKETTESRNGSKLWNAQEARQVLSELESSGQSQNTFAQSKGVSRSRLLRWTPFSAQVEEVD